MEFEAVNLELEQGSTSKHASNNLTATGSLNYTSGVLQQDVDWVMENKINNETDPFRQMVNIVWYLLPALLQGQEQSIAEIVPLVEANSEYSKTLQSLQNRFSGWGKEQAQINNDIAEGNDEYETQLDPEKAYFTELEAFKTKLGEDAASDVYAPAKDMLKAVERIESGVDAVWKGAMSDTTWTTAAKAAWNSAASAGSDTNFSDTSTQYYDKATGNFITVSNNEDGATLEQQLPIMTTTKGFQPLYDQANREMVLLQGMNSNMSQQVELELKFQIECYNSYVTSTGSMEDGVAKQGRLAIDRMRS